MYDFDDSDLFSKEEYDEMYDPNVTWIRREELIEKATNRIYYIMDQIGEHYLKDCWINFNIPDGKYLAYKDSHFNTYGIFDPETHKECVYIEPTNDFKHIPLELPWISIGINQIKLSSSVLYTNVNADLEQIFNDADKMMDAYYKEQTASYKTFKENILKQIPSDLHRYISLPSKDDYVTYFMIDGA